MSDHCSDILPDDVVELYALQIQEWVQAAPGDFHVKDIDYDFRTTRVQGQEVNLFRTYNEKMNRTNALEVLVRRGVIERVGNRRGWYRPVDPYADIMDLENAEDDIMDIILPMGVHKLCQVSPGIVVVAGEPNAGKTAFLLNLINLNMRKWNIHYFNSEMSAGELRRRLKKFDQFSGISSWTFQAYSRYENFADVIRPGEGNVNIIDFLEIHDEFYKVGAAIKQIHDRLRGALGIIAIQKNPGSDTGLGGYRTMEKPRLALAIEPGRLKITKAKNWVDPENNPNGKIRDFKLVQGASFRTVGNWYREERKKKNED
ncbi:MAG: hypothetical protein GY841_16390 [FCB group bacterium]|nr:hypothetical protein [FCB group bacterium]